MPMVESGSGEALPLAPAARPLLLVDQEVGSRAALRNALAARGFEVTAVAGGRAALGAAAERPFAFAVVEIRLGDGSGLALVEELRRLIEATRIVVVTGFDSFASVVVALRAGAIDYLPKPTDPDRVVGCPARARHHPGSGTRHTPRHRPGLLGIHPARIRAVRPQRDQNRAAAPHAPANAAADAGQAVAMSTGTARRRDRSGMSLCAARAARPGRPRCVCVSLEN